MDLQEWETWEEILEEAFMFEKFGGTAIDLGLEKFIHFMIYSSYKCLLITYYASGTGTVLGMEVTVVKFCSVTALHSRVGRQIKQVSSMCSINVR